MRTMELVALRTMVLLGTIAVVGLAGCGSIDPVAPHQTVTDAGRLYMALTLDTRAINLSTAASYNTLPLTATPRDALGNPMTGLPIPTFRSSDTTAVRVSPDGILTALQPATGVVVIAELAIDGPVRHADTAFVNVDNLPMPPVLASLSIHPVAPDTAIWSMDQVTSNDGSPNFGRFLPSFGGMYNSSIIPHALDTDGNEILGLVIEFTSLDPEIVTLDNRWSGDFFYPWRVGVARIVARTTAYGVTKTDTVPYKVTWPIGYGIKYGANGPVFEPSEIKIAPYGMVFWVNYVVGSDSIDVTFDTPGAALLPPASLCDPFDLFFPGPKSHCGTGDIFLSAIGNDFNFLPVAQIRRFTEPGIYTYRSLLTGATGRIVVTTES